MDHIIYLNEESSLDDQLKQIRFSYTRPYKLLIANDFRQLPKILINQPHSLLFYFTESMDESIIIKFKNLLLNYKNLKICLCSDAKYALLAWNLNLFHFIESPKQLTNIYKKFVGAISDQNRELVLKTNEGLEKISFDEITYLKADGNYTFLHLKEDKSRHITRQLGKFTITEKDLNIVRIKRSLILNLRNIKSIGNGIIIFYNCQKGLTISAALESKVKKLLLGNI